MADVDGAMQQVDGKIQAALTASESDDGASPVLVAVVREFAKKSSKAGRLISDGKAWEAIVELEQAGDSAKAAAEADGGASEATTTSVLDAHMAICVLKNEQEKALA
jgi:hypothetical protein